MSQWNLTECCIQEETIVVFLDGFGDQLNACA